MVTKTWKVTAFSSFSSRGVWIVYVYWLPSCMGSSAAAFLMMASRACTEVLMWIMSSLPLSIVISP